MISQIFYKSQVKSICLSTDNQIFKVIQSFGMNIILLTSLKTDNLKKRYSFELEFSEHCSDRKALLDKSHNEWTLFIWFSDTMESLEHVFNLIITRQVRHQDTKSFPLFHNSSIWSYVWNWCKIYLMIWISSLVRAKSWECWRGGDEGFIKYKKVCRNDTGPI
jgi:hypothetical protein